MPAQIPADPTAAVAATYDRLAPHWTNWADSVQPPLRLEYVADLLQHLPDGARVVELGCATGVPVGAALAERCRYHGIDASAAMVAAARTNVPAGSFEQVDMRLAEFEPYSLDAVVAFFSVVHVPRDDHGALFARIRRWLKPGGWFVASLANRDDPGSVLEEWLHEEPMYWSTFDAATNLKMLQAAGFEVVDSRIREQWEDGEPVYPQWVVCRAAGEGEG